MVSTKEKKQKQSEEINALLGFTGDDRKDFSKMAPIDLVELLSALKDREQVTKIMNALAAQFNAAPASRREVPVQMPAPAPVAQQQTLVQPQVQAPAQAPAQQVPQVPGGPNPLQGLMDQISERPMVQFAKGMGFDATKIGSGHNAGVLQNLLQGPNGPKKEEKKE